MNGGTYNILLNTTSKKVRKIDSLHSKCIFKIASVAGALSLLSYIATAVVSANSAMEYLQVISSRLFHAYIPIGHLGRIANLFCSRWSFIFVYGSEPARNYRFSSPHMRVILPNRECRCCYCFIRCSLHNSHGFDYRKLRKNGRNGSRPIKGFHELNITEISRKIGTYHIRFQMERLPIFQATQECLFILDMEPLWYLI